MRRFRVSTTRSSAWRCSSTCRVRSRSSAHLHEALRPGGHLVFDYIRSDGTGLDTVAALRDRLPALRFVVDNFEVVQGRVAADGSDIEPAVVRKR